MYIYIQWLAMGWGRSQLSTLLDIVYSLFMLSNEKNHHGKQSQEIQVSWTRKVKRPVLFSNANDIVSKVLLCMKGC